MRYHAFNESEDSDIKLVDTVAVRRLRPLPPAAPPSFLRSLRAGVMVEMLYEDGWWVGQLLLVSSQAAAPQLERFPRLVEGTAVEGADGRRRRLRLGVAAAPPRWELDEGQGAGGEPDTGSADGATTYLVESQPHLNLHLVTAAMLRSCQLWLWRPDRWETARSAHTVRAHSELLLEDERQRAYDRKNKKSDATLIEAKRLQKQEEMDLRRAQKEQEQERREVDRRKSMEADDKKRKARQAEAEVKKRKAEENRRKKELEKASLDGPDRWRTLAAKRGWEAGAGVESPLHVTADTATEALAGSWYLGTIADFEEGADHESSVALVDFELGDGAPLRRAAISLDALRPAPPPPPSDFEKQLREAAAGVAVELSEAGGWWPVKLVGPGEEGDGGGASTSDGAGALFTVRRDEVGEATSVPLARLRPGWQWKNSRWAGKWTTKVKTAKQEEREAAFEALKSALPLGATVEVRQRDESLLGAHYAGAIAEHKYPGDKVKVRYFELYEGDEDEDEWGGDEPKAPPPQQPLIEEEQLKHLRPVPPDP